MTNEELAARVKAGEPGAMLELWEAVRRFVEMKARRYAKHPFCRVQYEDLVQSGFLAMMDTVKHHDTEKGCFYTLLPFYLKARFSEAAGTGNRLDAIQYSHSLNEPDKTDEGETDPAITRIEDEGAALAFMGVEYADYLTYCRGVIGAALEELPQQQAAFLKNHYMEGRTLEQSAISAGYADADAGRRSGNRALHKLACGIYSRELWECLEAFEDFRTYHSAAVGSHWKDMGISQTEAAALVR